MSGDFLGPTLGASCGPNQGGIKAGIKLITPSVSSYLPLRRPLTPGNYSGENTGEKMRVIFLVVFKRLKFYCSNFMLCLFYYDHKYQVKYLNETLIE